MGAGSAADDVAWLAWANSPAAARVYDQTQPGPPVPRTAYDALRQWLSLAPIMDDLVRELARAVDRGNRQAIESESSTSVIDGSGFSATALAKLVGPAAHRLDCSQPRMVGEFAERPHPTVNRMARRYIFEQGFSNECRERDLEHLCLHAPNCAVRLVEVVPMWSVIADGRRVVAQVDPSTVVVTTSPALVAVFQADFDRLWISAERACHTLGGYNEELIDLTIKGVKVAAIARKLGVNERTVRRRLVALMNTLGVTTKSQLIAELTRSKLSDHSFQ